MRKYGPIVNSSCNYMSGEIIYFLSFIPPCFILQTIDKLGKTGDVVKVAPGHFRNHLMPKMLAVPNLDKFAILVREQRKVSSVP